MVFATLLHLLLAKWSLLLFYHHYVLNVYLTSVPPLLLNFAKITRTCNEFMVLLVTLISLKVKSPTTPHLKGLAASLEPLSRHWCRINAKQNDKSLISLCPWLFCLNKSWHFLGNNGCILHFNFISGMRLSFVKNVY